MRVDESIQIDAEPRGDLGARHRPRASRSGCSRASPAGRSRATRSAASARATRCACRSARPRSGRRSRSSSGTSPRHGLDERQGHRPARPLAAARSKDDGDDAGRAAADLPGARAACSARSADYAARRRPYTATSTASLRAAEAIIEGEGSMSDRLAGAGRQGDGGARPGRPHREDAGRGGPDQAAAPRPDRPRADRDAALGLHAGRRLHRERRALPGRRRDHRRARPAHVRRGRTSAPTGSPARGRTTASARATRRDHVPQPPRLHRDDRRRVEARA